MKKQLSRSAGRSGQQRKKTELTFAVRNFTDLPDDAGLTPRESAMVLGIGLSTYWKWLSDGRLEARRIGRTTRSTAGSLRRAMAGV